MRLASVLAGAAVIVALSLVAAPGSAGSRSASGPNSVDPAVFQPISRPPAPSLRDLDVRSPTIPERIAVVADPARPFEVAHAAGASDGAGGSRPDIAQPTAPAGAIQLLVGVASWYDNGTTAMRLPRGTEVRVCGPADCVQRTITDYGPNARIHPERVVDLTPGDFVVVCGCSLRAGLTRVTVEILG